MSTVKAQTEVGRARNDQKTGRIAAKEKLLVDVTTTECAKTITTQVTKSRKIKKTGKLPKDAAYPGLEQNVRH